MSKHALRVLQFTAHVYLKQIQNSSMGDEKLIHALSNIDLENEQFVDLERFQIATLKKLNTALKLIANQTLISTPVMQSSLTTAQYNLYLKSAKETQSPQEKEMSKGVFGIANAGNVQLSRQKIALIDAVSPLLYGGTNKHVMVTKINKRDTVEVLSVRLPSKDWFNQFDDIKENLIRFLDVNNIPYVLGHAVSQADKAQSAYFNKIEKYVFTQCKKKYKEVVNKYIEMRGVQQNLWITKDKLSFKSKIKKLKFGEDEIDCTWCINDTEIGTLATALGLFTDNEWNQLIGELYADASIKFPIPISLQNQRAVSTQDISSVKNIVLAKPKRNFTGFKM